MQEKPDKCGTVPGSVLYHLDSVLVHKVGASAVVELSWSTISEHVWAM